MKYLQKLIKIIMYEFLYILLTSLSIIFLKKIVSFSPKK